MSMQSRRCRASTSYSWAPTIFAEMGIAGDFANPKIAAAYKKVIAACRKHKKFPGMGGVYSEDLMKRYVGMGMRMIIGGGDAGMLMQAASQRASFLRGCL